MAAKAKVITYAAAEGSYWTGQPVDYDATLVDAGATIVGASRVTIGFSRTVPAGLREDRAATSFWVAKIVGGNLYQMVPVAELSTLETALDTFVGVWQGQSHSDWRVVEYAWHQVNQNSPRGILNNDPNQPSPSQQMGPATRVTVKNVAGTGATARLPDQVAQTVTFHTCSRRHWGRVYIPGHAANDLQTNYGRWLQTTVDALTDGVNALHDTWQNAGYQLGVYSQLHPAFMTPRAIQADDVPDIIRRRRPKQVGYRKVVL